ncbi:hypothetical protein OUZ56_020437 [Daphnia magna]|uniref:Uncharacterized protein n=1 Tax=Daphnia magna TaxID=35525 RepID=A0ABQ9ZEH1_9CRUS|nr:hypothetical protein OUZ56_020437 [Daphnia magna]
MSNDPMSSLETLLPPASSPSAQSMVNFSRNYQICQLVASVAFVRRFLKRGTSTTRQQKRGKRMAMYVRITSLGDWSLMYTSEIEMLLEGTKNELVHLVEVFKRNDDVACFHRKQTRPTVKLFAGQSAIQRKTADNVVKRAAYTTQVIAETTRNFTIMLLKLDLIHKLLAQPEIIYLKQTHIALTKSI